MIKFPLQLFSFTDRSVSVCQTPIPALILRWCFDLRLRYLFSVYCSLQLLVFLVTMTSRNGNWSFSFGEVDARSEAVVI